MSPKIPTDISNYQNIPPPSSTTSKHASYTSKTNPTSTLFCLSPNTNSMTTSEYENLLEASLGLQDKPKKLETADSVGRQIRRAVSSDESDVTLVEEKPTSTNLKRIAIATTSSPVKAMEPNSAPESNLKREEGIILDARGHPRRQFSPETRIPEPVGKRESPRKKQPFSDDSSQRNYEDSQLRRDSSQSDVSKFSHKSVTFNDNVQVNEIERSVRSQLSIDTTSSSSDDDRNDGSVVDLDKHLMPLRKTFKGSREAPTSNRYIQENNDPRGAKVDSQIYLTVTPMNHSGGSDVPEVSPTPLSQSWSSNEPYFEASKHSPTARLPLPSSHRSQHPDFQPLPMPEKLPALRKTITQDSNESYELQATFPKPDGMSDEEWRTMIQSIYVTETSNDPRNLGKDVREGENDSIHSFYLEDIYGPDIYQQIQDELPGSAYNIAENENERGNITPPATTANQFERRQDLDDWERLLVGSLTKLHAEDTDTGSVSSEGNIIV